jgi:hypothetical protein
MAISKHKIFERFGIVFDKNENTIISKKKLQTLLARYLSVEIYFEGNSPPDEGYLLVEKDGTNFDFVPINEFEEWQNDGSFEQGDTLYQIKLIKRF